MPDWLIPAQSTGTGTKQPDWVIPATPQKSTPVASTGIDLSKNSTAKYYDQMEKDYSDYMGRTYDSSGGGGEGASSSYTPNLEGYDGLFRPTSNPTGGEDPGRMEVSSLQSSWDTSKLPNEGKTVLGSDINNVWRVNDLDRVINKNAVVWDDNYGWITPMSNKKLNTADTLGPGIASLAMGGLMGAALPAGMITSGVKTAFSMAPSLAQGKLDPTSAALSLIGSYGGNLAGGMGLPDWVVPAAKTAYSVATNGINPASLVGSALSYGAGQLGAPDWLIPAAKQLYTIYDKGKG